MNKILCFLLLFSLLISCKDTVEKRPTNSNLMAAFEGFRNAEISNKLEDLEPYMYPEFFERGVTETIEMTKRRNEANKRTVLSMDFLEDSTLIVLGDTIINLVIIETVAKSGLDHFDGTQLVKAIKDKTRGIKDEDIKLAKDSSYVVINRKLPVLAFSINGGERWYFETSPSRSELFPLINYVQSNAEKVLGGYDIIWGRYQGIPEKK